MEKALKQIITRENNPYLYYHAARYEALLNLVRQFQGGKCKVLDVGNSPFSRILARLNHLEVDEIGFLPDTQTPYGSRYRFDLRDCEDPLRWRTDLPGYDLIVFAEVLEHLPISPLHVLRYLRSLLKEGGRIILQTPNAAVLHKRLQLVAGRNPFMLIREDLKNPGHFREYTGRELKQYVQKSGLVTQRIKYGNYFDYRYAFYDGGQGEKHAYLGLINWFYAVCPPTWKPGITMVLSVAND